MHCAAYSLIKRRANFWTKENGCGLTVIRLVLPVWYDDFLRGILGTLAWNDHSSEPSLRRNVLRIFNWGKSWITRSPNSIRKGIRIFFSTRLCIAMRSRQSLPISGSRSSNPKFYWMYSVNCQSWKCNSRCFIEWHWNPNGCSSRKKENSGNPNEVSSEILRGRTNSLDRQVLSLRDPKVLRPLRSWVTSLPDEWQSVNIIIRSRLVFGIILWWLRCVHIRNFIFEKTFNQFQWTTECRNFWRKIPRTTSASMTIQHPPITRESIYVNKELCV